MTRQNLFSGDWDGDDEELGIQASGCSGGRTTPAWVRRCFELAPGARGEQASTCTSEPRRCSSSSAARPTLRNQHGEQELAPGDFVFCPEGRAGLHTFSNPTDEPAQILAMSAGSFPDVVAYPEDGYAWVATRDPDPELLAKADDPGIIARFEIPTE